MTPETIEDINKWVDKSLQRNRNEFPFRLTEDAERQCLILSIHTQNSETLESAALLAQYSKAGDVARLSRAVFESVLNMGLLLSMPSAEATDRYVKYSSIETMKAFRHMLAIESDVANAIYKPEQLTEHESNEIEYVSKYGKPKTNWAGMNTIDICKKLDKIYPPVIKTDHFFEFIYCQAYRYGSSAVHGSHLGINRNLKVTASTIINGNTVYQSEPREESLIFNYFHCLISYLLSLRVLGKTFNRLSLEQYFQESVGQLIAGYA